MAAQRVTTFDWNQQARSVDIDGVRLEARCFGPAPGDAPTFILLHEGLGCVALWRSFPKMLSDATGWGVFAYSRAGYGASATATLPRPPDYMHIEAQSVVPAVLDAVAVNKCVLLGHSDGASIAAIYAGTHSDHRVRGLVLMAPHFFTEPAGLASIRDAREAYNAGNLRDKLGRYHGNVDNAFRGWNDAWLDPGFENWNIEEVIDYWRVPVLAIQGTNDQYGTLAQIDCIESRIYSPFEKLLVGQCQHAPHLEQPEITLAGIVDFASRLQRMDGLVVGAQWPLPAYAHIPGSNQRPDKSYFKPILANVSAVTSETQVKSHPQLRFGIKLIDAGFFWEAHEVLESVWNACEPNSCEIHLLQSLIQIANASLKSASGKENAALRLAVLAGQSADRAYPRGAGMVLGLDSGTVKKAIVDCSEKRVQVRLLEK